MMENDSKQISLIYEKRRSDAARSRDERIAVIYSDHPDFQELDYKIKLLGIDLSRNALSGNITYIENLKKEIDTFRNKKREMMERYSIDESSLQMNYYCEKCNDTGFVTEGTSSVRCSCYRALLIDSLYKRFSLDSNKSMTFDKFNIDLYSENADFEKYGSDISPRKIMTENYRLCREFSGNFSDPNLKNLLITGAVGVGKTFMCGCIANALIEKGIPVLYLSSTDMFNIITSSRMGKLDNIKGGSQIEDLISSELLIIDDLGTESLTESRCSEFLEILNKKNDINKRRPCKIVISTNLTPREIFKRYSARIGSRITSEFTYCKFIGQDIRMIDRKNLK